MKNRSRVIALALASAATIAVSALTGAAANAEEAGDAATELCEQYVDEAIAANDIDSSEGYTFACTPDTIHVQPEGSQPVDTATEDLPTGAMEESVVTGESASASARAAASVTCAIPTVRKIISELQVNVNFCMVYGQRNHKVNGTWTHKIGVEWKTFLGWPRNENHIRTTSADVGVGNAQTWGKLTLQRQKGILPPDDLITLDWQSSVGVTGYPWWIGGDTYVVQGTYAERMWGLEVTDFSKNVSIQIQRDVEHTPRYYCDGKLKRCSYPNGKEAPVL